MAVKSGTHADQIIVDGMKHIHLWLTNSSKRDMEHAAGMSAMKVVIPQLGVFLTITEREINRG